MNDPQLYTAIKDKLTALGRTNVLFYLSTQPSYYGEVVERIGRRGAGGTARRGLAAHRDRKTVRPRSGERARTECSASTRCFAEEDVYRIDHYLGKETVQNILAFRFGNGIFEPLWNRRYVNHVQITAAESIGVEGRGAYYQEAGALRDMIQNHLLQVMATVAMEPSAVFEPDAVRDERAKLLRSIDIMTPEEVPSVCGCGAIRGIPARAGRRSGFANRYLRRRDVLRRQLALGGRAVLHSQRQEAAQAHYRHRDSVQHGAACAVHARATGGVTMRPNLLILRIQPEEGISLRFLSKQPGSGMRLRPVSMDFNYGSSFGERSPSAYETLLVDAMIGDATLYTRQDMVEASWQVVQPILEDWANRKFDFPNYDPGTWGPAASDEMLARQGHQWRNS